jgi:hypothetical protein
MEIIKRHKDKATEILKATYGTSWNQMHKAIAEALQRAERIGRQLQKDDYNRMIQRHPSSVAPGITCPK